MSAMHMPRVLALLHTQLLKLLSSYNLIAVLQPSDGSSGIITHITFLPGTDWQKVTGPSSGPGAPHK